MYLYEQSYKKMLKIAVLLVAIKSDHLPQNRDKNFSCHFTIYIVASKIHYKFVILVF